MPHPDNFGISIATPSAPHINPESNPSTMNQSATPTTMSSSIPQTSSAQSSINMTAKATPSPILSSVPRVPQRPHSNAVHGARLKTAIAVPLSLLAFVLLLVGVFIFRIHQRRLADGSSSDTERHGLSRQSSFNSSRFVQGMADVEKTQNNVPEILLAPAPTFTTHGLRRSVGRDVETSPHQAFLMSPSLRQSSISSLDDIPNTVPAKTFQSWRDARAAHSSGEITSWPAPMHLRATPLSSSPLRQTLLRDEDDDEDASG